MFQIILSQDASTLVCIFWIMQVVIVNVGLLLRGLAPSKQSDVGATSGVFSLEALGSLAIMASSVCEHHYFSIWLLHHSSHKLHSPQSKFILWRDMAESDIKPMLNLPVLSTMPTAPLQLEIESKAGLLSYFSTPACLSDASGQWFQKLSFSAKATEITSCFDARFAI